MRSCICQLPSEVCHSCCSDNREN